METLGAESLSPRGNDVRRRLPLSGGDNFEKADATLLSAVLHNDEQEASPAPELEAPVNGIPVIDLTLGSVMVRTKKTARKSFLPRASRILFPPPGGQGSTTLGAKSTQTSTSNHIMDG